MDLLGRLLLPAEVHLHGGGGEAKVVGHNEVGEEVHTVSVTEPVSTYEYPVVVPEDSDFDEVVVPLMDLRIVSLATKDV